MTTRSHQWLPEALRTGMQAPAAYVGSELIDSW